MGAFTSFFLENVNSYGLTKMFVDKYLTAKGPSPHNLQLIPGGGINPKDSEAMVRAKFQLALRNQRRLRKAILSVKGASDNLSRYMVPDLDRSEESEKPAPSENSRSPASKTGEYLSPKQVAGFGNLGRLASTNINNQTLEKPVGRQSPPSTDNLKELVRSQDPPTASKERTASAAHKRARSRPESAVQTDFGLRTLPKSIANLKNNTELCLSETPSEEVVVETIQLGNKKPRSKRPWPSREVIKKAFKDPKNKPTTVLLARFRQHSSQEFIEVEYHYNRINKSDSFVIKGSIESLLPPGTHLQYRNDKINNNVDDRTVFLENLHHFFNNHEGRIWWNGYQISNDATTASRRMKLKAMEMDPPTMLFDMSGLEHVNATRDVSQLVLRGKNEDNGDARAFFIKGKTESDIKQIKIDHEKGTPYVHLTLPFVSSIPEKKIAV